MTDSDLVLVGAIASAVLEALKSAGLPRAYYGVVLIGLGLSVGGALGYGRAGTAGIVDGATQGIVAALAAGGIYGVTRATRRRRA